MTAPASLIAALSGRYTIERELGAGGMATVYLAQDVRHHRPVALKVLRPELAAILGAERFLKEIEVTANLQHPNILPLFDSGEAATFLFYVMPYVEGDTLRDRLTRDHQLPVDDAIEIGKSMAAALQYAHAHNVIHRDIKPGNVLLQGGQAVIADFGIALAVSQAGGQRLTETGLSLGTPHYMSPEQATGDRVLDARSDIYSLGAVVYEMLAGEPPHTGSSAQSVLAKVLTEEPAPLSRVRSLVPANVDAAVQRALAKAPADRFKSAADFAAALVNPSYSLPTTALRSAVLRGGALSGWKLGAALAGAAIVGLLAGRFLNVGEAPSRDVIQFSFPVRLGDFDYGPALDISADGRQLVYIGRDADDRPGLYRRSLGERTSVPIAGTSGFIVRSPSLSPDGQRVAYASQGQLRIVAINGGAIRTFPNVSATNGGLSWGANDDIVFQPSFGAGLMIVSANGGTPRPLTTVDRASGVDHRWPHVLPGGKRAIVTLWSGIPRNARIGTVLLATGEVTDLLPGSFARFAQGNLVFVGPDRSLQVVAFDPSSGKVRGAPFTVADSVDLGGDGAAQFAFSQSGTFVYFRSLGRRVPVLVDRAGKVTPVSVPSALYQSPRFSPDGRSFALEAQSGDIWSYQLATGTFSRLTDEGGGFYPVWTPDSRRILYSRDEQEDVNIYTVPVDRSAPPRVVVADPGQQRTQDLSPSGRHLLIRQNTGPGQYDLFALTLDSAGAHPVPWLVTPFLDRAPVFSRDGRWVAYTSDESGKDEVYVRPFPGPGGRIQVSSDGGTEPAWSADGKELYYRAGEVLKLSIETRPTFRILSKPQRLLPGTFYRYPWQRQWDVHPDGRRFVFLQNEVEVDDLTVVLNWIQTVRPVANR